MEENDEEEKEPIDFEFIKQNTGPENYENAFHLKWSGIQEENDEDIVKANFNERFKTAS